MFTNCKTERKITNKEVAKICHEIEWALIYELVCKDKITNYTDLKMFLFDFLPGYENNNYICEYHKYCNSCCFYAKTCKLWDMIRTAFETNNKNIILTIILKIKYMEV